MHKISSSLGVAARMLIVGSFLLLMPCWAAFWSDNRPQEGRSRGETRTVRGSAAVSSEMDALSLHDRGSRRGGADGQGDDLNTLGSHEKGGRDSSSICEASTSPVRRPWDPGERALSSAAPSSATLPEGAIRGFQERLQEMGAGYMRLERYPDPPTGAESSYHFVCRIPIPAHPLYERTFEAVDSDATVAMQRVVQDVELWQAAVTAARPLP